MFTSNRRIGIDLGTANSLVYLQGKGIVLNEPTVVAVSEDDGKVIAVGQEAKEMLGRTPISIVARRPMQDGVVADYSVTEAMIRYFLDKVIGGVRVFKPEVMVCAPAGVTSVERRAVLDATLSAGARTAYLIDESLAAAIGAGIPIAEASGHMIVDIGGGTTEVAVISLGGIVVHHTARVGGNRLDEAIASYGRRKHDLIIGERMAEKVKIEIGSAMQLQEIKTLEVKGRDAIAGLPKTVTISSSEVTEAMQRHLDEMLGTIKSVLEETPPELASDISDKGIVMSGGTSLLRNLDKFFVEGTGVPVHLAEDPLLCVAKGTGIAIENLDTFKRNVTSR
ncbi:rod shape-determining protein [candidate division WWE3 bacterium]|uniref:Cell shape-determining protein MreB n=1 Tax=candidate division WWE3 bacterium TaxID=2053526 RepID=A0A955LJD1_UNCKA|nr:rod shape-determining protein [candidate division WWE3 bacterium]